jgi:hypothetical protein
MWWLEWHCSRFFSELFGFHLLIINSHYTIIICHYSLHGVRSSPDIAAHYYTPAAHLRGFICEMVLGWSWSKGSLILECVCQVFFATEVWLLVAKAMCNKFLALLQEKNININIWKLYFKLDCISHAAYKCNSLNFQKIEHNIQNFLRTALLSEEVKQPRHWSERLGLTVR